MLSFSRQLANLCARCILYLPPTVSSTSAHWQHTHFHVFPSLWGTGHTQYYPNLNLILTRALNPSLMLLHQQSLKRVFFLMANRGQLRAHRVGASPCDSLIAYQIRSARVTSSFKTQREWCWKCFMVQNFTKLRGAVAMSIFYIQCMVHTEIHRVCESSISDLWLH